MPFRKHLSRKLKEEPEKPADRAAGKEEEEIGEIAELDLFDEEDDGRIDSGGWHHPEPRPDSACFCQELFMHARRRRCAADSAGRAGLKVVR